MVEFAYSSVMSITNLCLYPFNWWQLWLWTMMVPVINCAFVLLIFGVRMLYRFLHQRFAHVDPTRKCNNRNGAVSPGVNSLQAGVQLVFFNNLSIAKSCLIMFACAPIFGQYVTSSSYLFRAKQHFIMGSSFLRFSGCSCSASVFR